MGGVKAMFVLLIFVNNKEKVILGSGKQRTTQPRGGSKGHGENSFFFEIVLLWRSVWWW